MQKIHDWCMRNRGWTIFFGFLIIFLGLVIDYAWNDVHDTALSALSHLFIISGEAIIVMFFLHVWVEDKNHHEHIAQSKIIIDQLQAGTMELMQDQATRSQLLFVETMAGIQKEASLTTEQIKSDLFEALLKDKMPAEMVKQMLESSLFKPTFLRENLELTYTYDIEHNGCLAMNVDIVFDIEYCIGHDAEIGYDMPFSLSDSPIASYKLKEASYRRFLNGQLQKDITKFLDNEADFLKKEFGPKNEKDYYTLNKRITLQKKERIRVYQSVEVQYNLLYPAVLDSYYVNHHTLNTTIRISFPAAYEFVLYPSFPEEDLPTPILISGKTVYENIKLLIPGQGWGYSILKKN